MDKEIVALSYICTRSRVVSNTVPKRVRKDVHFLRKIMENSRTSERYTDKKWQDNPQDSGGSKDGEMRMETPTNHRIMWHYGRKGAKICEFRDIS